MIGIDLKWKTGLESLVRGLGRLVDRENGKRLREAETDKSGGWGRRAAPRSSEQRALYQAMGWGGDDGQSWKWELESKTDDGRDWTS